METLKIKIKRLDPKAVIPRYAMPGDAGMDLTAVSVESDCRSGLCVYHTGISVAIPKGYVGLVFPRSSNRKTTSYMTNSVGVIDSGYRGEILVCYRSRTAWTVWKNVSILACVLEEKDPDEYAEHDFASTWHECSSPYKEGERVAQLVVIPYPQVEFEECEELDETERGANGHGSTGA